MKKAQSISINTIVVAAIALVVMILIVMIFTGNIKIFNQQANQCENNGGSCIVQEDCTGDFSRVLFAYKSSCNPDEDAEERVCCVQTIE